MPNLSPSSSNGSGVSYKPPVNPAELIKKFGSGTRPIKTGGAVIMR